MRYTRIGISGSTSDPTSALKRQPIFSLDFCKVRSFNKSKLTVVCASSSRPNSHISLSSQRLPVAACHRNTSRAKQPPSLLVLRMLLIACVIHGGYVALVGFAVSVSIGSGRRVPNPKEASRANASDSVGTGRSEFGLEVKAPRPVSGRPRSSPRVKTGLSGCVGRLRFENMAEAPRNSTVRVREHYRLALDPKSERSDLKQHCECKFLS